MAPTLDRDSTAPAAPAKASADEVLVLLEEAGENRRELGEAVLDELTAERQLHALELRAERDGFASLRLWPARFPDFALEVEHGWLLEPKDTSIQDGFVYRQTGSARWNISRGRALGLLRLFATVLEKGGAE